MQKKKPVLPNAKALLNQWKTGPISDKVLTPWSWVTKIH